MDRAGGSRQSVAPMDHAESLYQLSLRSWLALVLNPDDDTRRDQAIGANPDRGQPQPASRAAQIPWHREGKQGQLRPYEHLWILEGGLRNLAGMGPDCKSNVASVKVDVWLRCVSCRFRRNSASSAMRVQSSQPE